jgi:hypothetical protein
MWRKSLAAVSAMSILALSQPQARAAGADVIVGNLEGTTIYARAGGIAALSVGTVSCNAGDTVLQWNALPSNRHPVIGMNMYRLLDNRLEHIGQSWVKHGFTALQGNLCGRCQANPNGQGLGVGCSDPYGAGNNNGRNLRARGEVNPTTGYFDPAPMWDAQRRQRVELPLISPIDRGLQVAETDMAIGGARYFVESHYIAADDAEAGNALNNTAYNEVTMTRNAEGGIVIRTPTTTTQRRKMAIEAWPGAKLVNIDADEAEVQGRRFKSRVVVASRVTPLGGNRNRYDYAVYNMNSDRGVSTFSIPVGAARVSNVGSSAVKSHGEPWSNDPWRVTTDGGTVTWATAAHATNPNANAIRWGTMYNFWFEADAAPQTGRAIMKRFKPGPLGGDQMEAMLDAPAAGGPAPASPPQPQGPTATTPAAPAAPAGGTAAMIGRFKAGPLGGDRVEARVDQPKR